MGDRGTRTLSDLLAEARDTLVAAGVEVDHIELNGSRKWQRPKGREHLWYVADHGTSPSGRPWLMVTAGNLKETGDPHQSTVVYKSWETDHYPLPQADREAIQRELKQAEQQRQHDEAAQRAAAREQAGALWSTATDEVNGHPYLTAKGVSAHGIRVAGDALLIPVRDTAGELHGLQRIFPDGSKRFTPGTAVSGHYHLIGTPTDLVCVAEGYASASTVCEATGEAVAASFNCGNLRPVAEALRAAHPDISIVVCGDDDHATEGNPGRHHAELAAKAVGARVVFPVFSDQSKRGSDFNDLASAEGIEAVQRQLADAITSEGPVPLPKAPEGWSLTGRMVFEVKEKSDGPDFIPVSGPLWIVGRTTGPHGEWGLVLAFRDHDGRERRAAIPAARLHEDATALARELATQGLRVVPGNERRVLAYLDAWQSNDRILSAKRLGWLEDPAGRLAYVMPGGVIGADGTTEVMFQPERFAPTVRTVHASGTLEEWRGTIGTTAAAHPVMLAALCAGLAPAALAYCPASDSFVLHLWGQTSRGKTALAQIAASPWGCAADPNDAPSLTFVRRWNLTGNGLEGLAEAHSDMPLILDELGAATVGDIRPLVYQLAGGQGKTALNSARELREPRAWRTIAVSTGELSLHARMSDPDGDGRQRRAVKGGLSHRALDIEVRDIAEPSPPAERGAIVERVKAACARLYGTAGPALVRYIVGRFTGAADLRAWIKARIDAAMPEIGVRADHPAETARALRRFALLVAVGELAIDAGILPTDRPAVVAAVRGIAAGWLSTAAETDGQRIITAVRGYILRHASRFQATTDDRPVPDRAGWRNAGDDLWLFTDAALAEAAPGHDVVTIARTLNDAGLLHRNDAKLKTKMTVAGGDRPRLYCVRGPIVSDEAGDDAREGAHPSNSGGHGGRGGQVQQPQGFVPAHLAPADGGHGGQCAPACPPAHLPPAGGGQAGTRATTGPAHRAHRAHPENREGETEPTGTARARTTI